MGDIRVRLAIVSHWLRSQVMRSGSMVMVFGLNGSGRRDGAQAMILG